MAKTLYTLLGDTYFKLNQDTRIPNDIVKFEEGTDQVSTHMNEKCVDINLSVNAFNDTVPKSNKELYNEMLQKLKDDCVTEIDSLDDRYKVAIDYGFINPRTGEEYTRYQAIDTITPVDRLVPLGVNTESECVYRRVKEFKNMNEFVFNETRHFGIQRPIARDFRMMIYDISIYQYKQGDVDVDHPALTTIPFIKGSKTVESILENMVLVFSSYDSGITFAPIQLSRVPKVIHVHSKIIFGNIITAYTSNDVNEILTENIIIKNTPDEEDPIQEGSSTETDHPFGSEDTHPWADGSREPDSNGKYNYYERCEEGTPDALHVVEDLTPVSIYIDEQMIHKSKVIKDIPDITVGEFVVYRQEVDESVNTGE